MAGHSQFKNIMHRKGAQDARRARQFAKLIREITVSARIGLPDPAANPRLRAAMAEARGANMPRDTIERAVKKATGAAGGEDYVDVRYEGYGPAGVAVIVEALTDNRNRTATNVGGLGVIQYPPDAATADAMLEAAIDAGADNAESGPDGHEVTCAPDDWQAVRDALEARFGPPAAARLDWRPGTTVTLDEERAPRRVKRIAPVEDHDPGQNLYANFEIPDAVLQALSA